MDTRPCYTMEQGYTSSDFTFYRKNPNSVDVSRSHIYDMQTRAGKEKWYQVDSYTHYWKSGHGSDRVLVLVNDKGEQLETCYFGWKRVPTEHELALKEKREYEEFVNALAALKVPNGLDRWHSEVIEMFENTYEEILYYGED